MIAALAELIMARGAPEHIRSDNGPEFTAKAVREWLAKLESKTLYIEPGSPWENGHVESFRGACPTVSRDGSKMMVPRGSGLCLPIHLEPVAARFEHV